MQTQNISTPLEIQDPSEPPITLRVTPKSVYTPPPLLHVSRAAREVCLQYYTLFHPDSLMPEEQELSEISGPWNCSLPGYMYNPANEKPFYVNLDRDVLCIGGWMIRALERMSTHPLLKHHLKRLAVNHRLWFGLDYATASRVLMNMHALRQFVMVMETYDPDDWEPIYQPPRMGSIYGRLDPGRSYQAISPYQKCPRDYLNEISLVQPVDSWLLRTFRNSWRWLLNKMSQDTEEGLNTAWRLERIDFRILRMADKEEWEGVMRAGELINWPPFLSDFPRDPRCIFLQKFEWLSVYGMQQWLAPKEEDVRNGKVKMGEVEAGFGSVSRGAMNHDIVWSTEDAATRRAKWERLNFRLGEE